MKVTIMRQLSTDEGVFGALVTEDGFSCMTLELPWRNNAVGKSCVPAGDYKVIRIFSPKHQKEVYCLQDVPGRSMSEIHGANLAGDVDKGWVAQLEGCIALGRDVQTFAVGAIPGMAKPQRGIVESAATVQAFEDHLAQKPFELEIKWCDDKG